MASYSAIQIASSPPKSWRDPSLVQNLRFTTNIPIPVPGPGQVVVNIKAASLNARDLMVTARDPVYPITTIPNLSPCSDCSGIIYAVGEGSEWAGKEGEKVVLCPSVGWKGRDMEEGEVLKMDELGGRGAGDVEGCLREYALVVSRISNRTLKPPLLFFCT
jgi:NADPH:quinone reductase-like Zn-dependent oxidoreductase